MIRNLENETAAENTIVAAHLGVSDAVETTDENSIADAHLAQTDDCAPNADTAQSEIATDLAQSAEQNDGDSDETLDDDDEGMTFEDLGLSEKVLRAVELKGFKTPSPIQILAIPRLLTGEANLIAKARTGTGKTAAFGLPLVQKITEKHDYPQALVLTPTRELCLQVCKEIESFATSSFPRMVACYGGAGMGEQMRALRNGVEIVVGTPGRVQDLIERGVLTLDKISYFILDEADEMLDMGFIEDIEAIFAKANPQSRILLFSATMPKEILKIASDFMGDYEIIEEEKKPEEPLLTEQHYWIVRENEKIEALVRLIDISPDFYGLIFTQTKIDADSVSRKLEERGYEAAALHGDIAQAQREKILWRFRNRKTRILVATDVAARGIDIEGLTHVVNYALPFDVPTYIHRIGRTGRAGKTGFAYTFVRPEERRKLEFLKREAFKATKGKMQEDSIPSVQEVLKIKRERLFEQTQERLTAFYENPELQDETCAGSSAFEEMAKILCEQKDPMQVLSSVLEMSYGKSLDPSHYGEIKPIKAFDQGKQTRIYVQLGRMDGYQPRRIAEYFSKLCHIPQRNVDRIDVSDQFSLVSLPSDKAKEIVARSKHDKSLPHMHFDTKDDDFSFSVKRPRKSENARREGSKRGEKSMRDEDFGRKERFRGASSKRGERGDKRNSAYKNERGKKSGFSGNRESGKKPVHTQKTSNAGLYKK